MRLRTLFATLAALTALASAAHALTARDLSGRMRIDGYTKEFITGDEDVFGIDPRSGLDQESRTDSKWTNNEVYQIRITWDAQYLYLAGEGKIYGNNMILFIDSVPGRGMFDMTNINSWRRNYTFDPFARFAGDEFLPDVFGATWDTNLNPRLITQISGNQVVDTQVGPEFRAAASLDQGNDGRAMEFAIPWRNVFAGLGGGGTRDTVLNVGGVVDTLHRMPVGVHSIKIAAVVTGSWDGSGGPDVAPDNLRGVTDNGNDNVTIDNYAIVHLDENDDTGMGRGGPDGIPDWGVSPRARITFRYPPPVTPVRFSLHNVAFDRPAFKPDFGDKVRFRVQLDPPLNPNDPLDQARVVTLSAYVYDLHGHWVRDLFRNWSTNALQVNQNLAALAQSQWDGRDASGVIVSPGVYIVRVVIENNLDRATRAVVVVR